MLAYRGSYSKVFKIDKTMPSRYGIKCLFFASNVDLAMLYAVHQCLNTISFAGGFVHKIEISDPVDEYDFNHGSSYCKEFRNLVYSLFKQNHKAVRIINVFDYPSEKLMYHTGSDIIIVFDFSCIQSVKLILSGIHST